MPAALADVVKALPFNIFLILSEAFPQMQGGFLLFVYASKFLVNLKKLLFCEPH